MEKAVDVAEKNMSRFGLSQAEISKRRKWVMQTRTKVQKYCGRLSPRHALAMAHSIDLSVQHIHHSEAAEVAMPCMDGSNACAAS